MVDVSIRLRKAILDDDLALLKRILKANPSYLQNTDYADKSNTSLHIAAQNGYLQIVKYLISLGHDASGSASTGLISWHSITSLGPSYNTDRNTPLHLAAAHSHSDVAEVLCSHFPTVINRANKNGATPLHLASQAHPAPSYPASPPTAKAAYRPGEDSSTVDTLLHHNADVYAVDNNGDSCLHYASTWGNLISARALIQAGAHPVQYNHKGWTPQSYSISVLAEVSYKTLVAEWERLKAQEASKTKERRGRGGGGLRLVKDEAHEEDHRAAEAEIAASPVSTERSASTSDGLRIPLQRNETWR